MHALNAQRLPFYCIKNPQHHDFIVGYIRLSSRRCVSGNEAGEFAVGPLQRSHHSEAACESESQSVSEVSDGERTDDEPKLKRRKQTKFQAAWLDKFKWLRWDEKKNHMFCEICRKQNKNNAVADGTDNFRTSTLSRHITSLDHQSAVREAALSLDFAKAAKSAVKQSTSNPSVIAAMRTALYMAKEDIPIKKYPSMVSFLKLQDCPQIKNLEVGKNATYASRATGEEFQSCMAEAINSRIAEQVRNAPMFSVLIDETTDISITKQMVVYARVVDSDFTPHTYFLRNIAIDSPSSDAQTLTTYLVDYLQSKDIDMKKCYALGSDGASVMVGKHKGVATKLKQLNPHMINIHCVAHRFNLCTSQASKSVPYLVVFEQPVRPVLLFWGKQIWQQKM